MNKFILCCCLIATVAGEARALDHAKPFGEPYTLAGKRIVSPPVGEIRIEVTDLDGKIIPGHSFADANPIIGDQYRTVVTWKNSDSLGMTSGKPLVLRLRMEKAKIYGLDFE